MITESKPRLERDRQSLMDFYKICKVSLGDDIKKLTGLKKRTVMSRDFTRVVAMYYKYVAMDLLNGGTHTLYNRMGKLRIVKRPLTRNDINAKGTYFENGKIIHKAIDINEHIKKFGYFWYTLQWDKPLKYKSFGIKMSKKLFKDVIERADMGFDYLEKVK